MELSCSKDVFHHCPLLAKCVLNPPLAKMSQLPPPRLCIRLLPPPPPWEPILCDRTYRNLLCPSASEQSPANMYLSVTPWKAQTGTISPLKTNSCGPVNWDSSLHNCTSGTGVMPSLWSEAGRQSCPHWSAEQLSSGSEDKSGERKRQENFVHPPKAMFTHISWIAAPAQRTPTVWSGAAPSHDFNNPLASAAEGGLGSCANTQRWRGGSGLSSPPLGCLQNDTTVICVAAAPLSAPGPWHLSGLGCLSTRGCAVHTGKSLLTGEEQRADAGRALPRPAQPDFLSAHSCLEGARGWEHPSCLSPGCGEKALCSAGCPGLQTEMGPA